LGLMNASFQFLFRVDSGYKVPVTAGIDKFNYTVQLNCCCKICTTRKRACGNETKAKPTIRTPIHIVNWRLPKTECLKRLCVMPKGEKFQVERQER